MKRFLRWLWLIGFSIGCALCLYWHLNNAGKGGPDGLNANLALQNFTLILWPSSLMLFALTKQHFYFTIVIESISVITNGFIYMGAGSVLIRLLRKNDTRTNDSTQGNHPRAS